MYVVFDLTAGKGVLRCRISMLFLRKGPPVEEAVRCGHQANRADLGHCHRHEPESAGDEGFAGFLRHVDARPLPPQPPAAGDARRGGLGREPLRVLNTRARPRLSRIALIRPVMIAIMEPPGSGDLGVCGMSFGER